MPTSTASRRCVGSIRPIRNYRIYARAVDYSFPLGFEPDFWPYEVETEVNPNKIRVPLTGFAEFMRQLDAQT